MLRIQVDKAWLINFGIKLRSFSDKNNCKQPYWKSIHKKPFGGRCCRAIGTENRLNFLTEFIWNMKCVNDRNRATVDWLVVTELLLTATKAKKMFFSKQKKNSTFIATMDFLHWWSGSVCDGKPVIHIESRIWMERYNAGSLKERDRKKMRHACLMFNIKSSIDWKRRKIFISIENWKWIIIKTERRSFNDHWSCCCFWIGIGFHAK